jgi:cytochrome c-type biogenesis protein
MMTLALATQTFIHVAGRLGGDVTAVVASGSLLLAVPIALVAGLVSFASPCVLPLVPGYLSYVTGMAGADLATVRRGRLVAGTSLFVLGFTVVFTSTGALFGNIGNDLLSHQRVITVILGLVTIAMGLAFIGVLPGLRREFRIHHRPAAGLAGAPLLGVLFGLGWVPCIGPTLTAVLSLSVNEASAVRGALLTVAYCLGLGVPFLLTAVAFRRAMGAFDWLKRHYVWVMRAGGAMLVVVGMLLVTGIWGGLIASLQSWIQGFTPSI